MLDLSKPLGQHEGLIFYGDHEHDNLVYYFPDEVELAPQEGVPGFYEMNLSVFSEGDVETGGLDALRNSAGSILQLGVECTVQPERLQKAINAVKELITKDTDLKASLPLWKDGSVNLIVLDSDTSNPASINEDSFVKSVVGSKKPSLTSSTLDSVFNIRLDRRGTAIVLGALNGDAGSLAGIMYDLKFNALRPALDMRIWANLDRCYESISHQLGVKVEVPIYAVKVSLGAEFGWMTKKLEEDGDLKIEVISQAENEETKKMMDEMIEDFKTSILREMFQPYVNPFTPTIPLNMGGSSMPSINVGVSYRFTKENISQNKILEVDYRERSTIVRTHNPQSHLWVMGKQIATNKDKYIQIIRFGELWREQELNVAIGYDFDKDEADLLSAELLIWRVKDGVNENPGEGHFSIPDGVQPIAGFTFSKENKESKELAWNYDQDEPFGYYYQLKFLYKPSHKQVSSPPEIITEPIKSGFNDLTIFPDTYTFYKKISIESGNIDFAEYKSIDLNFHLKDVDGKLVDTQLISLKNAEQKETWIVRGKNKTGLFVALEKTFHFSDNRPSITTEFIYLPDDEVIVNKPFLKSNLELFPVIAGKTENVKEILLEILVDSPAIDAPQKKTYRITGPDFNIEAVSIPLSSENDKISYTATAITADAKLVEIGKGVIESNALVLDLNAINKRDVEINWVGKSPAGLDLKELKLEFRINDNNDNLEVIKFSGDKIPENTIKSFTVEDKVEWRINKRYNSGIRQKTDFSLLNGKSIVVP